MPNDCGNTLTIHKGIESRGNEALINTFKAAITPYPRSSGPVFDVFLPTPEKAVNCDPTDPDQVFSKDGWYGWRLEHWGCKWDAYDIYVQFEDERVINIYFSTAWSPPIAFFEYFAKTYPDATGYVDYEEGGAGFCGRIDFSDGKCIDIPGDWEEYSREMNRINGDEEIDDELN